MFENLKGQVRSHRFNEQQAGRKGAGMSSPTNSARIEFTPEIIAAARSFAFRKWQERSAERGLPPPHDLSNSCKFTSLFAQSLFGGEIRGNYFHFHVRLPSGERIDLNEQATDVQAIKDRGSNPYLHERAFMRSRDVRESLKSCRPRVEQWVEEFLGNLDMEAPPDRSA